MSNTQSFPFDGWDKDRFEGAFNEWWRQYEADPAGFMSDRQIAESQEGDCGYGGMCVRTLLDMDQALAAPATGEA